jgi:hypothetical protein
MPNFNEVESRGRVRGHGNEERIRRVRRTQRVQALFSTARRGRPAGALGSLRQEPWHGPFRNDSRGREQVYRVRLQEAEEVADPKNRPNDGRLFLKVDVYTFILLCMNTANSITAGTKFYFRGNMGSAGFSGVVTKVDDGWFWYTDLATGIASKAPSPVALFGTAQWVVS